EQRDEEQHSDQAAPQRAAGGAAGSRIVRLMQLDLAVLVTIDDHGVLQLDRVLERQLGQPLPDLLGGLLVRVRNRNQIAHGTSIPNSNSDRGPYRFGASTLRRCLACAAIRMPACRAEWYEREIAHRRRTAPERQALAAQG